MGMGMVFNKTVMNDTTKNNVLTSILTSSVEETFKSGCRFVGLTYTNQNGAVTRYNLILGISLTSLYKSDLRTLKSLRPSLSGVDGIACDELIASVTESLTKGIGNNSNYSLKGYYTPITENKEVSLHTDENGVTNLYLRGYVVKSTVLKEGTYPHVNSSPKTLAKKKIEKTLKRGKIRTFKINVSVLHSVRVNGITVEIE